MANESDAIQDPKGFLNALVDPSFDELITPKIIKVLYILLMIGIGLGAVVFIISAFAADITIGLFTLFILAPLGALLYLIIARVYLELVVVLFKIKETNEHIAANTK